MLARRIYLILLVFSVLIGTYFYGIRVEDFDTDFLKYFSLVPFLIFISAVHGLLAHTLTPQVKDRMVAYPLVMGIVYVLLFFIHLFVILPRICPDT